MSDRAIPNHRTFFAAATLAAALLLAPAARAADAAPPIAVGEVAETTGVDATAIRETAEGELREIDPSTLPAKHRYVVSLSVARSSIGDAIACKVNAMLRDAKTGNMIAIIEAGAQASGSVSEDALRRVASAAVRTAMRRIPTALGAK